MAIAPPAPFIRPYVHRTARLPPEAGRAARRFWARRTIGLSFQVHAATWSIELGLWFWVVGAHGMTRGMARLVQDTFREASDGLPVVPKPQHERLWIELAGAVAVLLGFAVAFTGLSWGLASLAPSPQHPTAILLPLLALGASLLFCRKRWRRAPDALGAGLRFVAAAFAFELFLLSLLLSVPLWFTILAGGTTLLNLGIMLVGWAYDSPSKRSRWARWCRRAP
jgi:hypothetical protein